MEKPISQNNPPASIKLLVQMQTRLFKAASASPGRKFNLLRQLCSPAILQMGAERVDQVKGRRASANRPALPGMSASRLSQMLKGLAADVDSGNYKPMAPRKVPVSKGDGKTRMLTIPSVRDFILQQALLLLLHPIAEAELSDCSFGCRPGAGPQQAFLAIAAAVQNVSAPCHFIRGDITGCFDNISHKQLQEVLFRRIRGKKVRSVITRQLSKWGTRQGYGVPQGAPVSPLMVNWYLARVDKFFERRKSVLYFRYMDDFLIVVPGTLARAQSCLKDLEKKLKGLELQLNSTKTKVIDATIGVEFLGVLIRRNKAGFAEVQLTTESIKRIEYKIDHILNQPLSENKKSEKLHAAMAAWAGYYMQFNPTETRRVIQELQSHISTQLGRKHDPKPIGLHGKPSTSTSPRCNTNIPDINNGIEHDRNTILGDTQPPREVRAQNSLPFGVKVKIVISSVASEVATDAMLAFKPSEMTDHELGESRKYAWSFREYWGDELQKIQLQISQCKLKRRHMNELARAQLLTLTPAPRPTIDACLDKNETYNVILASERALRTRATFLNQCLSTAHQAIAAIDSEMTRRCFAVGLAAIPGLVHLARERTARRRSRSSGGPLRRSMNLCTSHSQYRPAASRA